MKYLRFLPVLLLGLFLAVSFQNVPEVEAGTNGQKIFIETGGGYPARIVISGSNQHGNWVTYDSNVHGGIGRVYLGGGYWESYINGWWWEGTVYVTLYTYSGTKKTCSFSVPTVQWFSDWYGYYCGNLL